MKWDDKIVDWVHVCVCVCVRARARTLEKERERERLGASVVFLCM